MATSNSVPASAPKQEPLDALQSLINDVLVQTGKALRASRKDSRGNLTHIPGTSQSKLPETIRLFHNALDELEEEIIEAKSVLLRDLNELQERKKKLLAQTQSTPQQPITIDIPSTSPEPMLKDEPMAESIDLKPMAPFPNMSIDLSEADHMDIAAGESNGQQPQPPPPGGMNGINGKASPGFASRLPAGDHKPTIDMLPETTSSNQPPTKAETSGMNFTNMEFTLAPSSNEASGQNTSSKEPFFDLTTFAPADGGDEILNLNNLLPDQPPAGNNNNNNNQPSISAAAHSISIPNANAPAKVEEPKIEALDPSANLNTEFFGNDAGAADGMDFDFSLGGSGDDTFDDLMNNRDSTFELMDAGGDFDTAFFGLDKPDETTS
ncbi:hypothetical protein TASIC1_0012027900 [Trichoderma asperellum]|uniref:Uncharacterized protein n=1 Tax=Trichoderma asperellum TaxID=101201 RepID=A0A6V8R586_TRIAP|nr:hypothetical protein LI328DRAFT_108140 [Trichoderma asperelloides]GFP59276.1 hypothetical protein TASIC1_0012027900 [Trichoderma asperellum]